MSNDADSELFDILKWHDGKYWLVITNAKAEAFPVLCLSDNLKLLAAAEDLRRAVKLVLAIADNPERQSPQFRCNLDPMTQRQLRDALLKSGEVGGSGDD